LSVFFPRAQGLKIKKAKYKSQTRAALLAQKSGAPILPVAISGRYRPFSKIKVVFGKPFTLDLDKNTKYTNSELVEFSESIMKKVYSLLGSINLEIIVAKSAGFCFG